MKGKKKKERERGNISAWRNQRDAVPGTLFIKKVLRASQDCWKSRKNWRKADNAKKKSFVNWSS